MALDTTVGGASADSYGTLAEYQAYGAAMGWTLRDTDAEDEIDLRRAALTNDRENSFVGTRQYQTQALSFPRLYGGLINDWPLNPDTIPTDIKNAQFEMAYLIKGGLDPFATVKGVIAAERVKAGPVESETEYQGGYSRPRLVAVEGLLGPYLIAGRGQRQLMRA